jgi:hypothetical protein
VSQTVGRDRSARCRQQVLRDRLATFVETPEALWQHAPARQRRDASSADDGLYELILELFEGVDRESDGGMVRSEHPPHFGIVTLSADEARLANRHRPDRDELRACRRQCIVGSGQRQAVMKHPSSIARVRRGSVTSG